MPTRRPLTSQTAQITTASVEIKTLTVSGRQVTMAVFRQLYQEPLFDPMTWEPAGIPWCRVNYHPDKCTTSRHHHEHIVWQKGDELRRARIDQPPFHLADAPGFAYDDEAALCLVAGSVPGAKVLTPSTEYPVFGGYRYVPFSIDHSEGSAEGKLYIRDHKLGILLSERDYAYRQDQIRRVHAEHHPGGSGCAAALAAVEARAQRYTDWWDAAKRCWGEIQVLDQVFIAV